MARRLRDLITNAYENGKYTYTSYRKVPGVASTATFWADLSTMPGNPVPNYYLGDALVGTYPTDWYKKSIWDGGPVSPNKKFIHKICLLGTGASVAPAPFILCDYLLYYPVIDMDSMDEQIFDNTVRSLPRYTTGFGVMAFLVATNPYTGGQYFYINYTNHLGVSGRVSQLVQTNTGTNISTLVNSNTGASNRFNAFIPLQYGDMGIRSVQSITFLGPNGGLAALVLVRPILTMMTRETTAWAEFDFVKDKPSLPLVYDGAYLNFLVLPSASFLSVPIIGEFTFIWGD
jgi:hypothetical protein